MTSREQLARFEAVKHFHHNLYGVSFIVITDHGALSLLMKFKNPSGQLARWLEVLRFVTEQRVGVKHGNCNALSRMNRPCSSCVHCERSEQEEREAQLKDGETYHCHKEKQENKDRWAGKRCRMVKRETTPKRLKENDCGDNLFSAESNQNDRSALNRDPTEWEMREAPRRNTSKTFGLSASTGVKGGGSTVENPNPFKCDTESVENGYVRYIHCFACSSTDSNESFPEGEKWKKAKVLDPGISVLYNWMEQNRRPTWEEISHIDEEMNTY